MIKNRILNALAKTVIVVAMSIQAFNVMAAYTIEVTDRYLYGPGPFPDQTLKTAWIRNINFEDFLTGKVKGVNNLGEEPNVSGEILQGKIIDGMLSDKTLISEDIDMSNAVIMNGQFNLLLAAVYGGPNNGDTFFYTDQDFNWWIKDDIGVDPGFAAGIVKINNFTFTTGPRIIPYSIQTTAGYPGGTNQTGSLEAGRVAFGRLGDQNGDGYLDGMFNAIGHFPMESIFLPGAPFVQLFEFKSDIPITISDAALLSIASTRSYLSLLNELQVTNAKHQDIPAIMKKITSGTSHIISLLEKVKLEEEKNGCSDCKKISELINTLDKSTVEKYKTDIKPAIENAFRIMLKLHRNKNA